MATTKLPEIPPVSKEMEARYDALIAEYHHLIGERRRRSLTLEQQTRLTEVEAELDALEACLPQTIYMRRQEAEIQQKFDDLLAYVETLPDK